MKYGDVQSTSNDGTRGQPGKEAWRVWGCVLTVSPSCCIPISLSSKFKKFSERYSLVSAVCRELRGRAGWWYRGKPPSLWSSLGQLCPVLSILRVIGSSGWDSTEVQLLKNLHSAQRRGSSLAAVGIHPSSCSSVSNEDPTLKHLVGPLTNQGSSLGRFWTSC